MNFTNMQSSFFVVFLVQGGPKQPDTFVGLIKEKNNKLFAKGLLFSEFTYYVISFQ